jgi:polyphosphate kinase
VRVFEVNPLEVFRLNPPLDYRFFGTFASKSRRPDLLFTAFNPRKHPAFYKDPFGYLDSQDFALYHPTDDFAAVERFLQVAALDPDVDVIRMTAYRLGGKSPMAEALMDAAKRGKDVAVLLEGRARFDELQNLYWRLQFESSGVRIMPLVPNYKVHAKILYVRHAGKVHCHMGTGNYNSANARLYTDLSLLTANDKLGKDAEAFFQAMEGGDLPNLQTLLWGKKLRSELVRKILAEAHPQGHVIIKVNHLTDPDILNALVEAADKGGKVELIVRSTLTTYYAKWTMKSVVGRFLEHPRMCAFKAGGEWEVWAGSADFMTRNFDHRIELLFPVLDPGIKQRVLAMLRKQLQDDRNGFVLLPDGGQVTQWAGRVDAQMARL